MSPRKTEFTERINVFFTPKQLEQIKTEADMLGLTVSAYVRMVVIQKRRKAYWFIRDYQYLTCSNCGYDLRTGCESMEEAEANYKKPLELFYCPHCGCEMTREDGSSLVLWQNVQK